MFNAALVANKRIPYGLSVNVGIAFFLKHVYACFFALPGWLPFHSSVVSLKYNIFAINPVCKTNYLHDITLQMWFDCWDVLQPMIDLAGHLKAKSESLGKKGLKLQPHVVVLTDQLQNVGGVTASYYACMHSGTYYCTASLLEAVDICLKSAFVFGVMYPPASHSCWSFLQRAVYGISSKYDRIPSRVSELLTDIHSQWWGLH